MNYKSYQHIERLGTDEVEGILNGTVYFYTKIDGTSAVFYLKDDGTLGVGSRKRVLSALQDNQGCYAWAIQQDNIKEYLVKHPNHILYGEFLIKNHIKNYFADAWKKAYIFDVFDADNLCYVPYEEYQPELEEFGIAYIPLVAKIDKPTQEDINKVLDEAYFLQEEKGSSEGIVLKRYDFRNKYDKQIWAKVVREEYKQKRSIKESEQDKLDVAYQIVDEFLTDTMIEKEYLKLCAEGWSSKMIPRLLNTVWHEFIVEESWNIIKKYKNPTINFKLLNKLVIEKIKHVKKGLF